MRLMLIRRSLLSRLFGRVIAGVGIGVSLFTEDEGGMDGADKISDNETGRVNTIFPGSSLHYCQLIDKLRYEDYHIIKINTTRKSPSSSTFS